jgi:hypothetical protein
MRPPPLPPAPPTAEDGEDDPIALDDDPGAWLALPEPVADAPDEPTHSHDGTDEPDLWALPPLHDHLDEGMDLPVVSATTTATLPDGRLVRAVLDPHAPGSTWRSPERPATREDVVVRLGDARLIVSFVWRPADVEQLVLGADALSGRVLIRP